MAAGDPPDTTNQIPDIPTDSAQEFLNLLGKIPGESQQAFGALSNFANASNQSIKELGAAISANNPLLRTSAELLTNIKSITKNQDLFGSISSASDQFGTLKDSIIAIKENWSELADKIPNFGNRMVQNLLSNAEAGQKMEMEFINMLAAGGNLGEVFSETGNITGDLASQTLAYTEILGKTGDATGMTLAQVAKYAEQLNKIPGLLHENVNLGTSWGANTNFLTGALKVLSGSGQQVNEILDAMKTSYKDLGNAQGTVIDPGQKGLQLFSQMSAISKELNLEFSDAKGYLNSVAEQFKLVGDNTKGATVVLNTYMDALRNTGLTSKASLDTIQGMVSAVGNLSTATKAFMSARNGGPGGLQGAFQIEQLLRQGKVDQVVQMAEKSLKEQLGGKIYTQQEAANSPQAAAQFFRQRTMLESGAFGALAGTGPGKDERATRLLEALATGNRGSAVKVGQDALSMVAEQGNNLQETTNTLLTGLANSSQKIAAASQLTALNTARTIFTGANAEGPNSKIRNNASDVDLIQGSSTSFSGISKNDFDAKRGELLKTIVSDTGGALSDVQDGFKKAVSGAKDLMVRSKDLAQGIGTEVSTQANNKKTIANTPSLFPSGAPGVGAGSLPVNRALTTAATRDLPIRQQQQAIQSRVSTNQPTEHKSTVQVMIGMDPSVKDQGFTTTVKQDNQQSNNSSLKVFNGAASKGTPNEPGY